MKGKYEAQLKKVFLCIAVIFIVLIITASSVILISFLKSHYRSTTRQAVNSEAMFTEVATSTINSAITSLMKNTSIQTWAVSTTKSSFYYEAMHAMNDMSDLRSTFSAIPFYPAVTRLDENSLVISSLGTSSKKEYFQAETNLSAEQVRTIFTYFFNNSGELIVPVYDSGKQLTDIYYVLRRTYSRSDLLYLIRVPRTSLFGSKSDSSFIIYNSGGILACSDSSPDMIQKSKDIYQRIRAHESIGSPPANQPLVHQSSDIYLTEYSKSSWQTAYIYDTASISIPVITAYIAAPLALLCILFFAGFHFLSNWLYRPIREVISDVIPSKPDGVVDEFGLIRQNAAAARELAGSLQSVMQENTALIHQKFYRDLILGLNVTLNPLNDDLMDSSGCFCVGLFKFQENEDESLSSDIFFSKNTLLTWAQQYRNLKAVNISHLDCVLIIQAGSIDEAKLLLQAVTSELPEKQEYKIAVSTVRTGIKNIRACYLEACRILEYQYLYIASDILTAEQVQKQNTDNYYYPIIIENRLIQYLAQGRRDSIEIFDNLIRENFTRRDLTPETLRSFIYSLLGTVTRTLQELKTNPQDLLSHSINFESYYSNWSSPNIISWIRTMLMEILDAVETRNRNSDSNMLDHMRGYIYGNYSRDITLDDMAGALDISAKYCSNLFKKLSNDTFKNFLNHYRIDQAKRIIELDHRVKIADLSQLVGFNSSNTFIRVFGKYTGMTPGAYAASVKQEEI